MTIPTCSQKVNTNIHAKLKSSAHIYAHTYMGARVVHFDKTMEKRFILVKWVCK